VISRPRLGRFSPAPLRSPAFRRWLLASAIVNVCLWIYVTGVTWTVLTRTGSAATVSLVQTLMTIPLPLAMLPAGVLTDRFGAHRMMRVAYIGYASTIAITGFLFLNDALPVTLVLGMAFLLGCFDAQNVVASPVFVGRSVPPDQMSAAISFSVLSAGLGRIAGGPIGGFVVATFGPSAALLPAAVALVVALIVVTTLPPVGRGESVVRWRPGDLLAGVRWARMTPIARFILGLGGTMSLFVSGYVALLPVAAKTLIGGGAAELGWLTAAGGVGVISASFAIDSVGRRVGRIRTVLLALTSLSVLLTVLASSRSFLVTAVLVALMSAASSTYSATTSHLLQAAAPPSIRGRAVALYGLVYYALQPVGIVTIGVLTDRFGAPEVLLGMAAATATSLIVVVALNRAIWPAILHDAPPPVPLEAIPRVAVGADVGADPAVGS
jgi:MFS family permease